MFKSLIGWLTSSVALPNWLVILWLLGLACVLAFNIISYAEWEKSHGKENDISV